MLQSRHYYADAAAVGYMEMRFEEIGSVEEVATKAAELVDDLNTALLQMIGKFNLAAPQFSGLPRA